jgi:FAD/FMN-containing dehydrogenase
MITTITKRDVRYPVLHRSRNARFPANDAESVAKVFLCETADDAAAALQQAINTGMRPTIRSSGHCYEDFVVNNPDGALIDVSLMNRTGRSAPQGSFFIEPGASLGDAYSSLYRMANVTIPGGTCCSVAAGGHITGGGYGMLARQYGLTVDWLTAADVLTVDSHGHVVARHVNSKQDPDLFRALRGAGGAGYGLVTRFYFDKLPTAPAVLHSGGVGFAWKDMTEDRFVDIVLAFGEYMASHVNDADTHCLFLSLGLTKRTDAGSIWVQACQHDMDGHGNTDLAAAFLNRFKQFGATQKETASSAPRTDAFTFRTQAWIDAMIGNGGGPYYNSDTRAKYKSCYMKQNFTAEEAKRFYRQLSRDTPGVAPSFVASIDSYGGAVNDLSLVRTTAKPQRNSCMKVQYQMYWGDAANDAAQLKYLDELYSDIYSANVAAPYAGAPFHNDYYEGCYINYPDVDMLRYPFWEELYYGKGGLYPFLQSVKHTYDPHSIFHHSMTPRA